MSGRKLRVEPPKNVGGFHERVKKALTAKRDLEELVILILEEYNEEELLTVYELKAKNEDYDKLIAQLDLDFDPQGEEYEKLRQFEFDILFTSFDKNKLTTAVDLLIDFQNLERTNRRLYAKSKEIQEYQNNATQEREEVSLLQQFFEIKRAKLTGEKIKEQPKMLDVLTQRFKANPIFDEQGKEISSIADIAKYLERKYEKAIDLDDEDLGGFISSWKEHAKEEGKRLEALNEKLQGKEQ